MSVAVLQKHPVIESDYIEVFGYLLLRAVGQMVTAILIYAECYSF